MRGRGGAGSYERKRTSTRTRLLVTLTLAKKGAIIGSTRTKINTQKRKANRYQKEGLSRL